MNEQNREMLQVENLTFSYPDAPAPALNNLSLTVERGSFVVVLGANGSGKSTLAKHFNAILQPGAGRVLVDGMDTKDDARLFDIRQRVGMVFQNPDNQIVATTVEEDVAFALENLGVPTGDIRRRIDEAMKTVGIFELAETGPHKLSGGQKQRVAIAGVIAMEPDCIVLDEATAMLDPRGRSQVMDTVEMLNREKGITVVHITHYMEEAARADRVVVMHEGRIVMDGTPREVFSHPDEVRGYGLDVPDAAELSARLRGLGFAISNNILTVDECVDAICDCMGVRA